MFPRQELSPGFGNLSNWPASASMFLIFPPQQPELTARERRCTNSPLSLELYTEWDWFCIWDIWMRTVFLYNQRLSLKYILLKVFFWPEYLPPGSAALLESKCFTGTFFFSDYIFDRKKILAIKNLKIFLTASGPDFFSFGFRAYIIYIYYPRS